MVAKVLFVDDEPNILRAFKRELHGKYEVQIATSAKEGLDLIAAGNQYAIVLSDMMMPYMDGIEFLKRVSEVSPTSVRVMLTGLSDQGTAAKALNEGRIFLFLSKPCSVDSLTRTLERALGQHRLITAEKELLHSTLGGSIKILTDVLAAVDPGAFGRGRNLKALIQKLASVLHLENSWEVELAAMLASIGWVLVPAVLSHKVRNRLPISEAEQTIVDWSPEKGATLLANIPRLENVAKIVRYQRKNFDGTGFPNDSVKGNAIPIGARLLAIARDFLELVGQGETPSNAISGLRTRLRVYDTSLISACEQFLLTEGASVLNLNRTGHPIAVQQLRVGQTLLSDVMSSDGALLATKGVTISNTILERIGNYARVVGVKEPIMVDQFEVS